VKVGFVKEYNVGSVGRTKQDPIDEWYLVYTGKLRLGGDFRGTWQFPVKSSELIWQGNFVMKCGTAFDELMKRTSESFVASSSSSFIELEIPPPPEVIVYTHE
jgi:hypothetical protein